MPGTEARHGAVVGESLGLTGQPGQDRPATVRGTTMKVHKCLGKIQPEPPYVKCRAKCWRVVLWVNATTLWENVTCKDCLRKGHKRSKGK
jgi:hypothetical protein